MNKKVYIALSADFLHHGHINLIKEAKKRQCYIGPSNR